MKTGPAREEERIAVPGLDAPAEIVIDTHGIAHIRAASERDAFFLQGFNAARDRLWQIDLWRKRGLGLLAADFGPGFLEQDKASRLLLYRGDMAAEWSAYGVDMKAICEAFVAGINAYVALTAREPARLPPEFAIVGTRPARWAAEDVVRIRSHGLTRNGMFEILRANVLRRADAETDLLRKKLEPAVVPSVPDGLDLADVPLAAADLFRLGTAAVTFTPERLAATREQAAQWRQVNDLGEVLRDLSAQGSNNWAVAPSRTETGRPILASDPHRLHAVPSLRYLVHLTAPGLDVIGAGEPCVPGISFGHNGHSAFSMTIFSSDQEDIYVYETSGDGTQYRYGEGWEPFREVTEQIAVKDGPDEEVTLRFTRHGPVLHEDRAKRRAVALRSVWFEPGTAPYLASLGGMRATSLDAFRQAMKHWGSPGGNQVYADVTGTIAWFPTAKVPIRANWNGLLPVPGDGRYEWQGFWTCLDLPVIVNPKDGFVATANEMNLPADWDHAARPVGFEWVDRSRISRIRQALDGPGKRSLADSRALQTDTASQPARRLRALIGPLASEDGDTGAALALLKAWNARLDADSAAALLFELWWMKHLRPALLALFVPDAELRKLFVPMDMDRPLDLLEAADPRFGPDPVSARDALLLSTLKTAFADARERQGSDPSRWRWGRLHHGYFEHALTAVAGPSEHATMDVGPFAKGGSSSTPMHTGYRLDNFRIVHGASFRMVLDVGDWDRSVCMNSPGQSGDPRSPHYRDLAPLWARGAYVPLPYSREAVDAAAGRRIVLEAG